jgi:hypothetical protein
VDQIVDRPENQTCTETPARWTSGGALRTGGLLAAAAFASLLMVDLPIPASSAADDEKAAPRYVPASDKWIELGIPQRPAASPWSGSASDRLQADLVDSAAVASPAAEVARDTKPRQLHRKPRGEPSSTRSPRATRALPARS